jgi:hypothetical protein
MLEMKLENAIKSRIKELEEQYEKFRIYQDQKGMDKVNSLLDLNKKLLRGLNGENRIQTYRETGYGIMAGSENLH